MTEENINQEFRLKKIGIIEEVNRNELISKTRKKICTTLSYIENFLNLALIFAFTSIIGIPIGVTLQVLQ